MKVNVQQGNIVESSADTIVVNLFEGVTSPGGATGAVDQALDGAISDLIAGGDFTGKANDVAVLYPRGSITARRVLVVGLGKADKLNVEVVRRAAASAIKRARDLNARHVATIVHGAGIGGLAVGQAAQATAEGSLLALYRFEASKRKEEDEKHVESLTIVEFDEGKVEAIGQSAAVAEAIIAGVTVARNLVNMPPNVATPTKLATTAEEIAGRNSDKDMKLLVGDREWAAEHHMGAFLAVAQGPESSRSLLSWNIMPTGMICRRSCWLARVLLLIRAALRSSQAKAWNQ